MNTTLADSKKPWVIAPGEVSMTLEIGLLKRTIVLSWSQFVYAEGGDDEVHIAFATHDVFIRGAGLAALVADVSAQRVASIYEPSRADRFPSIGARCIREIEVRKIDAN
jgi:hypothetical protein